MLADPRTSRSEKSSKKNSEIQRAVREMRTAMKGLPLTKLAKLGRSSPAVLCHWERGCAALQTSRARLIHGIVRSEFAKYARRVAAIAARHGIGRRARQGGGA